MRQTPNQRLAGMLLGEPVLDWLAPKVAAGASCRELARALRQATNGQIDITGEAIRRWLKDADIKTARALERSEPAA